MSTSRTVLNTIPNDLRSDPNLDLNLDALAAEKALGIMLNWQEYRFLFKVKIKVGSETYRSILSDVCGLYDPLGFWTPITLSARIILQDICRVKPECDAILPEAVIQRWERWVVNLHHLESVTPKMPTALFPEVHPAPHLRRRKRSMVRSCVVSTAPKRRKCHDFIR